MLLLFKCELIKGIIMKKSILLNFEFFYLVVIFGYIDEIMICDVGLLIFDEVMCIDFVLIYGVFFFLEIVWVILFEL